MKEVKVKTTDALQKHSQQATEEQLRVAKLSQMHHKEDRDIQEQIKEVSDITRKPPDIVSVALHDCNYDTHLAIQNIFDGKYEGEDEWQTRSTKKGKKSTPATSTPSNTMTNDEGTNHVDSVDEGEQKPPQSKTTSRGGGAGLRGRSAGRNKRDEKQTTDEKWETSNDDKQNKSSERGRSRGRGRGSFRGAGGRGGRGGFGRGAPRGRSRGTGRGGRRSRDNQNKEVNGVEPSYSGGFGAPATETTDSWDLEDPITAKVESWADDIPETDADSDWAKVSWADQTPTTATSGVDSLFSSSHKVDWSQLNGNNEKTNEKWEEEKETAFGNSGKYVPEQIDTAVICSIPTSATTAEVTSYQPTNDISRYITSPASNQFPSSQQEGGLINTLNEREFSLPSSISSMPMVSGITESHKLEEEQLNAPKPPPQSRAEPQKVRKNQSKNVSLPSQPVVMPRSAQIIHESDDQLVGLEFGSPVSPRLPKNTPSSSPATVGITNANELASIKRQPVASLNTSAPSTTATTQPTNNLESLLSNASIATHADSKHTNVVLDQRDTSPTGITPFKSMEKPESHFMGSPSRGMSHGMTSEPIPFPSSSNLTSTASKAPLNVFGLTSSGGTVSDKRQPSDFRDTKVYDSVEKNINAEKILAEQKALAEKQYLVEQQRVLAEQKRDRTITGQRAFAEQKALAQQKLLHNQRSKEDIPNGSDAKSLPDKSGALSDARIGLPDSSTVSSQKDSKIIENSYSKPQRQSGTRTISSPPGLSSFAYGANASKNSELLSGQAATTNASTSAKGQSKTTGAPPGMLHPNLLYAGVQPGMVPAFQHQLHGYNYEEILQMQRLQMPQSAYHYDLSSMYPTAAANTPGAPNVATAAAAVTSREGLQSYQGATDSKFQRPSEESTAANAHVAANNMNAHQPYMNTAAGQLPYGFTYYQPGVLPQAGIYPAYTTPNIFQLNQAKGVVGTQYQSQYANQGFNASGKFSGAGSHDFSKGNFHSSATSHTTISSSKVSGGTDNSSAQNSSQFKGQGYSDAKGLSSMTSQQTMALHGQTMNPYLLQHQQTNLLTGQVNSSQLGPHRNLDSRGQVAFSGNQQKRDGKANYQSYWPGNNR